MLGSEYLRDSISLLLVLALLPATWGCGSGAAQLETNDPSRIRLQALGIQYARYLNLHSGKLPPSEIELKRFISAQGKTFLQERGIANVDSLFVSPRDNQPLVVSYGTNKLVRGFSADPMVAHEQKGIDGLRLAVFPGGAVLELDEEMFSKLSLAKRGEEGEAGGGEADQE